MKTNTKAIIIGLVAYLLVYSLKHGYETLLFTSDAMESQNRLLYFASTILALMLLVIPSYLSGLFVVTKGTLIGFLVALSGFSIRFFVLSVKWSTLPFDLLTISIWIEQMLVPITVGAVSGAAGQLHRTAYIKRLQVTPQ